MPNHQHHSCDCTDRAASAGCLAVVLIVAGGVIAGTVVTLIFAAVKQFVAAAAL